MSLNHRSSGDFRTVGAGVGVWTTFRTVGRPERIQRASCGPQGGVVQPAEVSLESVASRLRSAGLVLVGNPGC